MQRVFLVSTLTLVGALLANPVAAQQPAVVAPQEAAPEASSEMTIGSVAPPIDIEYWVSDGNGRFKPFNEFEPGKVYVIEFWATWCMPCVASMPHLADLQNKYADQGVTIVSVSDEPLETVEKFLEREVMVMPMNESGEAGETDEASAPKTYAELTSAYCLTTDPDGSVKNDYFRAAGQSGIPCAFIVGKDGVVEWLGHPMEMDKPLEQVVTDSWDRAEFAETYRIQNLLEGISRAAVVAARKGDYETFEAKLAELKNLELTDALQERMPELLEQLDHIRLLTMLTNDPEGALEKLNAKGPDMKLDQATGIGAQISQQAQRGNSFDPALVDAVTALIEEKLTTEEADASVYNVLAGLYLAKGDLDMAIELQQKAVDNPPELPEPTASRYRSMMESFLKQLKEKKAASDAETGQE